VIILRTILFLVYTANMSSGRYLVFDCDSTLSGLEGVDELALLRGQDISQACEGMTMDAMEGRVALESIFAARLNLIKPTQAEVVALGQRYIETVEPTALEILTGLRKEGWQTAILSGGFTQAILPLANYLGIDRIEAVPLVFDQEGNYVKFDSTAPTCRSGGKLEVLAKWRREFSLERIVMVGDGSSDLETKGVADFFVGFGRYLRRAKVEKEADSFILSLEELPALLQA